MNDEYGRHGADAQLFISIRLLFTFRARPRVLVREFLALSKQLKTIVQSGYVARLRLIRRVIVAVRGGRRLLTRRIVGLVRKHGRICLVVFVHSLQLFHCFVNVLRFRVVDLSKETKNIGKLNLDEKLKFKLKVRLFNQNHSIKDVLIELKF